MVPDLAIFFQSGYTEVGFHRGLCVKKNKILKFAQKKLFFRCFRFSGGTFRSHFFFGQKKVNSNRVTSTTKNTLIFTVEGIKFSKRLEKTFFRTSPSQVTSIDSPGCLRRCRGGPVEQFLVLSRRGRLDWKNFCKKTMCKFFFFYKFKKI